MQGQERYLYYLIDPGFQPVKKFFFFFYRLKIVQVFVQPVLSSESRNKRLKCYDLLKKVFWLFRKNNLRTDDKIRGLQLVNEMITQLIVY